MYCCICIGLEGWQALMQLLQCLSGAVEATVHVALLQLACQPGWLLMPQ
jgi:hypothetical protein